MALNSVSDINSYVEQFNNSGYDIRPEWFYNKQLLDTIRLDGEHYVHYRVAERTPIGDRSEKLQLRRWAPLRAHTTPLEEGVPPKSDKGSMEKFELGTYQYGRYMEFTDKVDFELIDPMIAHYTKEYSLVAMETFDVLARDEMLTVGSSYFANGRANIEELVIGDVPSMEDLRYIVLTFKRALVKPYSGKRYQVIASPEFYYDMVTDELVEKYMTINQSTYSVYSDTVIPSLFEMDFYETQAGDNSGEYTSGNEDYLRVYRLNTNTQLYEYDSLDGTTYLTVSSGYEKDSRTGYDATYDPELREWDLDTYNATAAADGFGEFQEFKIDRTILVGMEALVRTAIEGRDQAKMYVKQKGSAGVLDPIDQRQSIGFKIDSVGFGSPRPEAIAVYYSIPQHTNIM